MTDIVISAHNEESTIAQIVSACKSGGTGWVIVVCDDCTDNTANAAKGADVVLEISAHDKGSAMAAGLEHVLAPHVLFCDADLIDLSPYIVTILCELGPKDGQLVGLTESMINKWSKFGLPPITGERRLPTEFARTIPMAGQGYKVELVIDAAVGKAGLPHRTILMNGVKNPTRVYEDPVGWSAMWADLGITSLKYLPDLARFTFTNPRSVG